MPPRGQVAIYHALAGPKRLFVLSAGHAEHEGQAEEIARRDRELAEFLGPTKIRRLSQPDSGE